MAARKTRGVKLRTQVPTSGKRELAEFLEGILHGYPRRQGGVYLVPHLRADWAGWLPPFRGHLVDAPVRIGGIVASRRQAPAYHFRIALAVEPKCGNGPPLRQLKKRLALVVLAEGRIDDDTPTRKQERIRPLQAFRVSAFRPIRRVDSRIKFGALTGRRLQFGQLFSNHIRSEDDPLSAFS